MMCQDLACALRYLSCVVLSCKTQFSEIYVHLKHSAANEMYLSEESYIAVF